MLFSAAISLAAFSTAGCSEKKPTASVSVPSAKVVTTTAVTPSTPNLAFLVATSTSPEVASAVWSDIKDGTYDTRAQFFAGLKLLEAKVASQVSELTATRAAMKSTTDTKDWDFAMKEMVNAQAYLKSSGEELSKATPDTWSQLKDKVGQAWVRTQDAYAKVKASTTG